MIAQWMVVTYFTASSTSSEWVRAGGVWGEEGGGASRGGVQDGDFIP